MTTPQVLGERYEIGGVLGRGGMAEVHRGRDLRLGREVAVKVLRSDLARDPSFQVRFRREAQASASLNHPAIVAVYDTGEDRTATGATPYIVMEYVEGETLRDVLRSEVHRGRDLRLGREVAVKVLRSDLARDPSFQVRFRREAQASASLNHPAIVAVYDTGEDRTATGATPYIVMEYVEGETLRDVLRREGRLSPERAMSLC